MGWYLHRDIRISGLAIITIDSPHQNSDDSQPFVHESTVDTLDPRIRRVSHLPGLFEISIMCGLASVPTEILNSILEYVYLEDLQTLVTARRTSKRLYAMTYDTLSLQNVFADVRV